MSTIIAIELKNAAELKTLWEKSFSSSFGLIDARPGLTLQSELTLALKVPTGGDLLFPARIVQTLPGTGGSPERLVVELLAFEHYGSGIPALIEQMTTATQPKVRDFTPHYRADFRPTLAAHAKIELLKRFLDDTKRKNYYEILEISEEAGDREIKQAYLRLGEVYRLEPNQSPGASEFEQLSNTALRKLSQIIGVLQDPLKRRQYNRSLEMERVAIERAARPIETKPRRQPTPPVTPPTQLTLDKSADPSQPSDHAVLLEMAVLRGKKTDDWLG